MTHDFRWFDLVVRAELPERGELLAFLSAYFEPAIRIEPARGAVSSGPIAMVTAALGPPPPDAPDPVTGAPIAVDRSGGFLRCDGWLVETSATRWIWLVQFDAMVRVRGPEIAVWAPDERRLRVPLLRIVEDVVIDEAQRRGAVVVHASSVVADDRAIVFCGNKGAGKTTALIRALEIEGVALLANDNVCLVPEAGGYRARAWPAFFKAEVGTVASTGLLAGAFPPSCAPWRNDPAARWDIYEKVALYPRQAAAQLGAATVVEAPLGALVFPQFRPDHPPALAAMPADAAAERLPAFLQGVLNPNHGSWLGARVEPDTVRAALQRFIAWLTAAGLPLYALSWAPSIADLIGRLPHLGGLGRGVAPLPASDTEDWPPLPASPLTAAITFKSRRTP
jgi:hypothetical protein